MSTTHRQGNQHGRRRVEQEDETPELYSIFCGEVTSVQEYGAFVKIPGYCKNGLVHKTQISVGRVDDVSEVLTVGDRIFCKVISLGDEDNIKISLSMKVVDQGSGKDLDKNLVQTKQEEQRRKKGQTFTAPKIELGAVFNTVCKKCGTKGHLARDCFQTPGGKTYDLLPEEDLTLPEPVPQPVKKKKKKDKKKKKSKRQRRGSTSSPNSECDGNERSRHHGHSHKHHHTTEETKRNRHHELSDEERRHHKHSHEDRRTPEKNVETSKRTHQRHRSHSSESDSCKAGQRHKHRREHSHKHGHTSEKVKLQSSSSSESETHKMRHGHKHRHR